MAKYIVWVERTLIEGANIEVEADNRNAAKQKAIDKCEAGNFPEFADEQMTTEYKSYSADPIIEPSNVAGS